MAKCGHCNSTGTRLEEISPAGGQYKMMAICCSSCSAILGVTNYFNTGVIAKGIEKTLTGIKSDLDKVSSTVRDIQNTLRRR
jgi:hypothetical protein